MTSDSIPGGIMNGEKVEEILVSNGEVILSERFGWIRSRW